MSYAFVFIGRSGCGKGTQAELLKAFLASRNIAPVLYIETGNLFREFIQGETFSQRRSKDLYERSVRQPDFLACHMWSHLLLSSFEEGMSVIFDGTPRSLPEAQVLVSSFTFFSFSKVFVINLDVSREWSEKRLRERGRFDDQGSDKITKRLDWYDMDVLPAVSFFEKSLGENFVRINGEQSIELVEKEIQESIVSRL